MSISHIALIVNMEHDPNFSKWQLIDFTMENLDEAFSWTIY